MTTRTRLLAIIVVLLLGLSVVTSIASSIVVYPLIGRVMSISPPIILSPKANGSSVGPNGTSGTARIVATNSIIDIVRNGDFATGFGAWWYAEYDDDGSAGGGYLRGYWFNASGYKTWGFVGLAAIGVPDRFSSNNTLFENVSYPCNSLQSANLSYAYAIYMRYYNAIIAYAVITIGIYLLNWSSGNAQLLNATTILVLSNISWTPVTVDVSSVLRNYSPGEYGFIVFVNYYVRIFSFWTPGSADIYVLLDDIHLNVSCNEYTWCGSVWGINDLSGAYMLGLRLDSYSYSGSVGTVNVYARNDALSTSSIYISNGSVVNSETDYIEFNSSDTLLDNGTIELCAGLSNNTTAKMNMTMIYYAPLTQRGVVVYYPLNITIVSSDIALSSLKYNYTETSPMYMKGASISFKGNESVSLFTRYFSTVLKTSRLVPLREHLLRVKLKPPKIPVQILREIRALEEKYSSTNTTSKP